MKTLILTPNKNEMCGMYQLAKQLAEDFNGDIGTLRFKNRLLNLFYPILDKYDYKDYDRVITFLYPMHLLGRKAQKQGTRWIVYDQKVPPDRCFKNIFKRMYMDVFRILNRRSMIGADDYWELSKVKQKPRWTERFSGETQTNFLVGSGIFQLQNNRPFAIYLGRKTDYKNFDWLKKTMKELDIPLMYMGTPMEDDVIWECLSKAKLLVSASLWEGYGRPVMEAEALGIPAIAYDVGTHKKHIKKGICVPVGDEEAFKKAVLDVWNG